MKIIITFFIFLSCSSVFAQSNRPSVLSSAGTSTTVGNLQVSWTLGETFTQTFSSGNNQLSQGFQQVFSPTEIAKPTISPATGTYTDPLTVTITCPTPGATIYYTTSGNLPVVGTGFTKVYAGPFQVIQNTTVRAMAVLSGLPNSAVAVSYLTITNPGICATPVISPGSGSYSGMQTMVLSTTTTGASIYYTTNGNLPRLDIPNSFTRLYTGPFQINSTTTVKAITVKAGLQNSPIASATLTITSPTATVATPVISPGTGIFASVQTVSISCATPGATIYYTTSGNVPVIGAGFTKLYTGSFTVASSTTIRAMATAPEMVNSGVGVSYITIGAGRVAIFEGPDKPETEANFSLLAFPNPTNGDFKLLLHEPLENAFLEIYNSLGQSMERQSFSNLAGCTLSLSGYSNGIYHVKVVADNFRQEVRVLKY